MIGPIPTYDLSCDRCEYLKKNSGYEIEDGYKEYWHVWNCGHPELIEAMKDEQIRGSVVLGYATSTPKWCPEIIQKFIETCENHERTNGT